MLNDTIQKSLLTWLDTTFGPLEFHDTEVSFDCPFCGKGSRHFHLNLETGVYLCFRCGQRGRYQSLVRHVERLSSGTNLVRFLVEGYYSPTVGWDSLAKSTKKSSLDSRLHLAFDTKNPLSRSVEGLEPLTADSKIAMLGRAYLESRGVDLKLAQTLGFQVSSKGRFSNRLIMPIIENGRIVNFTARDLLSSPIRYLNPRSQDNWSPKKALLFNLDNSTADVLIVEGIFDALGVFNHHPVALLGKTISSEQILKILAKKPQSVTVLLDAGFATDARQVANLFIGLVPEVRIATMTTVDADPSSNSKEAEHAIAQARDVLSL